MPLLLYTWNRAPNFKVFSYSSCEKPCISSLKNFTRQIFNIFKIDQVINFKRLTILPLPNKAYLGHLFIPYLVYLNNLIKYLSNWLIYSMMWRLFVAAKLLHLNVGLLGTLSFSVSIHPLYHPMFLLLNGKHINQGHGIRNIFLEARVRNFAAWGMLYGGWIKLFIEEVQWKLVNTGFSTANNFTNQFCWWWCWHSHYTKVVISSQMAP